MNRYRCMAPSGTYMYTAAPSIAKARMNFEWRLRHNGMYYADARTWASNAEVCNG